MISSQLLHNYYTIITQLQHNYYTIILHIVIICHFSAFLCHNYFITFLHFFEYFIHEYYFISFHVELISCKNLSFKPVWYDKLPSHCQSIVVPDFTTFKPNMPDRHSYLPYNKPRFFTLSLFPSSFVFSTLKLILSQLPFFNNSPIHQHPYWWNYVLWKSSIPHQLNISPIS